VRLLVSGGGTAGHVYPLLVTIEMIKKKLSNERVEVLYVGSKGGIEQRILKNENIPTFFIFSGKWRRYWFRWPPALFSNIKDMFLIIFGFFQSLCVVVKFRPEIVFVKGGYVTIPIIFAAKICNIPIISHESDVVIGLSNKISSFFAKKICVSFPKKYYLNLRGNKIVYTGNPVRKEFFINNKSSNKKLPIVLVIGGSQGSEKINETIYKILPDILSKIKIIHITGKLKDDKARQIRTKLNNKIKNNYEIYDYLEKELADKLTKSDLVISRAGANSLSEISACGKPSIIIPLKNSASDHQRKNAVIFQEAGAAEVITEDDLKSDDIRQKILTLCANENKLKNMAIAAKSLSSPKAAEKIAEIIIGSKG